MVVFVVVVIFFFICLVWVDRYSTVSGLNASSVTSALTVCLLLSLRHVCPHQALGAGTSGQPPPVLRRDLCLHRWGGEAAASRSAPQPGEAAGSHPGNPPCLCTLCILWQMYGSHRSGAGLQHLSFRSSRWPRPRCLWKNGLISELLWHVAPVNMPPSLTQF